MSFQFKKAFGVRAETMLPMHEPALRGELVRLVCAYLADRGEVAVDKLR